MSQLWWQSISSSVVLILLSSSTATTQKWDPAFVDVDPLSPVVYDFHGTDRICISLSSSTTVVVSANVTDPSLSYSVDMSSHVGIQIAQTRRTCYHNPQEMCLILIITSTSSSNLTEGEFNIFYKNMITKLSHGPLGFSDPTGSNRVLIFTNNTAELLYRQTVLSSSANMPNTGRTSVNFQVCSDGNIAHFQASAFPLADCRVGTGAGGFSVPYAINLVYIGSHSLMGQHSNVISSVDCRTPTVGTSYEFIALDAGLFTPSMLTPPTTTRPPPYATISDTPTTAAPNMTFAAFISIPVVVLICCCCTIGLLFHCRRKREQYRINNRYQEEERIPDRVIPKHVTKVDEDEADYPDATGIDHDTKQDIRTPAVCPPQACVSVPHPSGSLSHPNTAPVVRRENSVTDSKTTDSMAKMDTDCIPHQCCQPNIAGGLNSLNQSVDTLLLNTGKILSNQETIINNQYEQELVEQQAQDSEITEC